jgi:glycosyltransferase involved in cell wall biosynthesis
MKVLVVANATYADPPTRRVFDHVANLGVDVLLAMPRRITHPFGPSTVPVTPWKSSVRLELLDTWNHPENGTRVFMKGISRLIDEFRPDLVHCVMEPWSLTCLQLVVHLKLRGTRNCKLAVNPAETKPDQGTVLTRYIRTHLYRWSINRCDLVLPWSEPVLSGMRRIGAHPRRVHIAPAIGVNTAIFSSPSVQERRDARAELNLDSRSVLVTFIGRFVVEKGVIDLVFAMDRAKTANTRLRLLLVGAGPLRDDLVALAHTRPWLSVLRPIDQGGVARIMKAADILVLPSKTTDSWEEQFGLVLIEAMASGLRVVASSSGAIPSVIGADARLFVEGDVRALATSIIEEAVHEPAHVLSRAVRARRAVSAHSDRALANTLYNAWSGILP